MAKSKKEIDAENSAYGCLMFIGLLVIAALLSPGMLAMTLLCSVSELTLDSGQMWTFSVLASIACLLALRVLLREWKRTGVAYLAICGSSIAVHPRDLVSR
jgi:hypothetical protein